MTSPVSIERLPSSEYLPSEKPAYVDVMGLHALYDKLAYQANLVLIGGKGQGKTLSVYAWAEKNKKHIVTYDCSEDVRRSNLIGQSYIRGDQTPFVLGPVSTAFEVANEVGGCILALEEINALAANVQKILNPVTDFRRKVEVPESGKVFKLKEGAKLWVVGTMNFSNYAGVYSLNEDLKSRFRFVEVGYPAPSDERKVVQASFNPDLFNKLVAAKVVDAVLLLAHETRQRGLEYALSTRDVVNILTDFDLVGAEIALRMTLAKFEDSDKSTVRERISSIFGIALK